MCCDPSSPTRSPRRRCALGSTPPTCPRRRAVRVSTPSRGCSTRRSSAAPATRSHSAVGRPSNILLGGNDAQKETYLYPSVRGERRDCLALTEPGAGSDLRGMRTRAVREERDGQQGWRIKGTKHFISHADDRRLRDPVRAHRPGDGPTINRRRQVDVDLPGRPRHPRRDRARRLPQRLAPRLHQLHHRLRLLGARRRAAGRGGQGSRPGRHLARLARGSRWRRPASVGPSARSTSPYATPRSASSSARRSADSRASASSWPTWPWS